MTSKRTGNSKFGTNQSTDETVQKVLGIAKSVRIFELEEIIRSLMEMRDERIALESVSSGSAGRLPDNQPVIAESEGFWRQYLGNYLSADEVRQLLGLSDLDKVNALVDRHELLAVPTAGGRCFPAFQFIGKSVINPVISQVICIFSEVVVTPYTTASWLRSIRPDGHTLQDWLEQGGDPERVIAEARRAASIFSN